MNTDSTLTKFLQVQDLVDRLFEFDLGRKTIAKLERIGLSKFTVIIRLIQSFDRKVLPFQSPDRHRHPTLLIGVIMYLRLLSALPADGQQLKPIVSVDQISRVMVAAPVKVPRDRIDIDRVIGKELVHVVTRKFLVRNRPKAVDNGFYRLLIHLYQSLILFWNPEIVNIL